MQSMTGYGSSLHQGRGLEIEISVKAVNGRFLDLRLHAPKEYAPFEPEWRTLFKDNFRRGTVDVYIHRRVSGETKDLPAARLNRGVAKTWVKWLREMQKDLGLAGDISVADLIALPQVVEGTNQPRVIPGEAASATRELKAAIKACAKTRAEEGKALARELSLQLKTLEGLVERAESLVPDLVKQVEVRLIERLSKITDDHLSRERLGIEAAMAAERGDVREEIVRLRAHAKACRTLLASKSAEGRKLDFYGQELLREVNTIGSKSFDARLTDIVVRAKSVVEKFREQVQNIE